jgi:hypothetical protein
VNSLDCYSYRLMGKLTAFFQLRSSVSGNRPWTIPLPSFRVLGHPERKVGSTLTKSPPLRITLNIDGSPITSRTHAQTSHSQTSSGPH